MIPAAASPSLASPWGLNPLQPIRVGLTKASLNLSADPAPSAAASSTAPAAPLGFDADSDADRVADRDGQRSTGPLGGPAVVGSARGVVADLNPSCFAIVMATGIVSLACHLLEFHRLAQALFALNVAVYALLVVLTLMRLLRFPRRLWDDLVDHRVGVGFFTLIAASGVLANQFLELAQLHWWAVGLWAVAAVLGFVVTYTLFTGLAVKAVKPSLPEGIHGGWLLSVVAVQSISVSGTLLAGGLGDYAPYVLLYTLSMWLMGGMLYIWIISLIFYRYCFFPLTPHDLTPPYWINMGAMAISTLAGAVLLTAAPSSELLLSLVPFIKGLTLMFWATATWWIPLLLLLGVWRHVYMRYRLVYDTQYWGAIFPLGMYTAATYRLAQATGQLYLLVIPRYFIYVALAAWALAFAGLLARLADRRLPDGGQAPLQ